jgi:hypothetical protein
MLETGSYDRKHLPIISAETSGLAVVRNIINLTTYMYLLSVQVWTIVKMILTFITFEPLSCYLIARFFLFTFCSQNVVHVITSNFINVQGVMYFKEYLLYRLYKNLCNYRRIFWRKWIVSILFFETICTLIPIFPCFPGNSSDSSFLQSVPHNSRPVQEALALLVFV